MPGDESCMDAGQAAKKDFDFQVYGQIVECANTFQVTWTTTVGIAPYWCSIIPLDGTYSPWDVMLAEKDSLASSSNWVVNMTTGTRFTVVMQ